MKLALPKDNNSVAIQALYPNTNVNLSISSGGSVRVALPTDTNLVRIATNQDCYIKFGDSGVVATTSDMFFPVGAEVFSCTDNEITYIAALGTDPAAGVFSATKMV